MCQMGGCAVERKELNELKKWISELSDEEQKQRKIYLRDLAAGELQGPPVGYTSIDEPYLKHYNKDELLNSTIHTLDNI